MLSLRPSQGPRRGVQARRRPRLPPAWCSASPLTQRCRLTPGGDSWLRRPLEATGEPAEILAVPTAHGEGDGRTRASDARAPGAALLPGNAEAWPRRWLWVLTHLVLGIYPKQRLFRSGYWCRHSSHPSLHLLQNHALFPCLRHRSIPESCLHGEVTKSWGENSSE